MPVPETGGSSSMEKIINKTITEKFIVKVPYIYIQLLVAKLNHRNQWHIGKNQQRSTIITKCHKRTQS